MGTRRTESEEGRKDGGVGVQSLALCPPLWAALGLHIVPNSIRGIGFEQDCEQVVGSEPYLFLMGAQMRKTEP